MRRGLEKAQTPPRPLLRSTSRAVPMLTFRNLFQQQPLTHGERGLHLPGLALCVLCKAFMFL